MDLRALAPRSEQLQEVAESASAPTASDPILRLHEALEELASFDARKHEVIELKYFGGATVAEISQVLQVAPRTVERDLRLGRAWLAESLGGGGVPA
ncbi:MAG: ECF-type sigma factor [Acidobacteriota bacterium]